MMSPEDRQILERFASRVRQLEPDARIWAFGSRTRGDGAPDSDLDLFVVVPDLTAALRRDVRAAAWELGFEHERVLSAVLEPREQFENGPLSASTLVKNLRKDGIAA